MGSSPAKINKTKVRESLLEQLRFKGADKAVFISLVDDYMRLWTTKEMLLKDIKTRGIFFNDFSAQGKPMKKQNPSTKEVVAVSKQMLTILDQLGITTNNIAADDDDVM